MSNELLYRKIYSELKEKIESGELKAGQSLPTLATLRNQYDVSHITILRVFQELKDAKLIVKSGKRYLINSEISFPGGEHTIFSAFRSLSRYNNSDNFGNRIIYGLCNECFKNNLHFHMTPISALLNGKLSLSDDLLIAIVGELKKFGNVAGILVDMRFTDEQIEKNLLPYCPKDTKIVIVGRKSLLPVFSVGADFEKTGFEAAKFLSSYSKGKFIAVQGMDVNRFPNDAEGIDTFISTLIKYNIPKENIEFIPNQNESNINWLNNTLSKISNYIKKAKTIVTIFSYSGLLGRVFYDYLTEQGFSVGTDFRLLICSGEEELINSSPKISAITYDAEDIGTLAISLIKNNYDNINYGFYSIKTRFEFNETL